MKTSFKFAGLLAFFLFLVSFKTQAQCPYLLSSNLSCPVIVDIKIYSSPPTNCTTVCFTQNGISVPAGAVVPINCGNCSNICNIEVEVVDVNGTTCSAVASFSDACSMGSVPLCPAAAPCNSSTMGICFDGVTFKIHR